MITQCSGEAHSAAQDAGSPALPQSTFHLLSTPNTEAVVLQKEEAGCGAASLATLLKFVFSDIKITESLVLEIVYARLSPADRHIRQSSGLNADDIEAAAKSLGYRAASIALTFSELRRIERPIIVYLRNTSPSHYAVLRGIYDGYAFLADPSVGRIRIPIKQFAEMWENEGKEGIAIAVEPRTGVWPSTSPLYLDLEIKSATLHSNNLTLDQVLRANRDVVLRKGAMLTRFGLGRSRSRSDPGARGFGYLQEIGLTYGATDDTELSLGILFSKNRGEGSSPAVTLDYVSASYNHALLRDDEVSPILTLGFFGQTATRGTNLGAGAVVTLLKTHANATTFASISTSHFHFGDSIEREGYRRRFEVVGGVSYQLSSMWGTRAALSRFIHKSPALHSMPATLTGTSFTLGILKAVSKRSFIEVNISSGPDSERSFGLALSHQFR